MQLSQARQRPSVAGAKLQVLSSGSRNRQQAEMSSCWDACPRDRCPGFINGYLIPELLEAGHVDVGLDDHSKYGPLTRSYDEHPYCRFVESGA